MEMYTNMARTKQILYVCSDHDYVECTPATLQKELDVHLHNIENGDIVTVTQFVKSYTKKESLVENK